MKTKWIVPVLIGVTLMTACTPTVLPEAETTSIAAVAAATEQTTEIALPGVASADTTDPSGLIYVRQEEKLARDVYSFLYDRWGLQVFQNIASSEQTHTDSIKSLLESYALIDPAATTPPGEFSDTSLQALYDQMTAQGSLSLGEALKVGAAIEEIDILDLQARLPAVEQDDIRIVYENLLSGSYNHLLAFTSTLERQTGETYLPQYMNAEAYQAALSLASTGGYGGGNGNGQGGRP